MKVNKNKNAMEVGTLKFKTAEDFLAEDSDKY